MAKVIFTAWKTKAQLIDVRSEFYPLPSYDGPDMRSHACATVEAWKLRGNVPHHVEATALLTDAILHDDAQSNSIFSIRATYSAAFCRFVTGLVDTKVTGPRRSMFQRAADLGLPASFVELRHEATHREPPSLVVLRKTTQRSLEWLWDNYWAGIDVDEIGSVPRVTRDDSVPVATALRGALQQVVRRSDSKPVQKKRKREQEDSVAARLVEICSASKDGPSPAVGVLPVVLLDEGMLVDSERKLGESMDAIFDKWDPVLQQVTTSHPSFLLHLSEELVHTLALNSGNSSPENAQAEGLFLWLEHLLTSPAWKSRQAYFPRGYISTICSENSNHWTQKLVETLQKHGNTATVASRTQNAAKSSSLKKRTQAVLSDSVAEKLREHGWGPIEKWDSRPLGVASTS
ncbi:uncharacterized protein N7482_007111 [Penicillium canariense]|uniref:Cell morphogenesis protein Las1 n=1 Tax=Penicillium canariense TaxID=189055 RepID=A0A9W9HZ09_9EURO|nr:uncharacterized protein N7482_007111 [Penicillium canariense]KAJ5160107.1 hypothetical protein N7482_007111 [Penicillium canariense]